MKVFLAKCTKEQLLKIADSFRIKYLNKSKAKEPFKLALRSNLIQKGVLAISESAGVETELV